MSRNRDIAEHDDRAGHGSAAYWLLIACCVPTIAVFALVALKVI